MIMLRSMVLVGLVSTAALLGALWGVQGAATASLPPLAPLALAPEQAHVAGEVLVKFTPGTSRGDADAVVQRGGGNVDRSIANGTILVVRVPVGDEAQVAQALSRSPQVEFAEPNFLRQVHDGPNDAGLYLKWDLNNTGALCDGSDCATFDADVGWQEAYNFLSGTTLTAVTIAVLDTGADLGHPDLKLTPGINCLNNPCNGDPSDGYGHGTHVAGIAAAVTNNGAADPDIDTAGVAFANVISVMPVKVCSDTGSCPTDAIVNGIYYAADHGARVINMSLGGTTISQAEINAIIYANGKKVLLVASAGNSGTSQKSYPAAAEEQEPAAKIMAIAATNWHDQKAGYSNYGADWVDLAAPGGDMGRYHDPGGIYSAMPTNPVYLTECVTTGPNWARRPCYSTGYDQLQGTSMASPQVAGAAALLFALGYSDNAAVRTQLQSTADAISGTGSQWANGRLNVCKAVGAACDTAPPPTPTATATPAPTPTPTATPSSGFNLAATGYKVKGLQKVDLAWSDDSSASIDVYVYRNGALIATTSNTNAYTDNIDKRGGGTYTYKVCKEADTSVCSNQSSITF